MDILLCQRHLFFFSLAQELFVIYFLLLLFKKKRTGARGGGGGQLHFLLQLVKFVTENRAVMDGIIIGRKERIEVCGPGNFCISRC